MKQSEKQTDRGEVDGKREDDEGHDPEHCLHGLQVGVVNSGLCTQLEATNVDIIKVSAVITLMLQYLRACADCVKIKHTACHFVISVYLSSSLSMTAIIHSSFKDSSDLNMFL